MPLERLSLLGLLVSSWCLTSCGMLRTGEPLGETMVTTTGEVVKQVAPVWTVNEEVYAAMERGRGRIEIEQESLRLKLINAAGEVAIETDCSTGIDGRTTPYGNFKILEMIVDKRSNKYGKYVSKETGEVVVDKSWEVSGPPPGTKYLGTAMPYWMRLTWDGVGIHVGEFPQGYRTSFGCIRMPEEVQPLIYQKCRVGMPVKIY